MMNLRPQKRIRSSGGDVGRDRLSEMPDEVLVNILSLMPTLDAVRTVLLRRFGNLWTLIHNLEFDTTSYFVHERRTWICRFIHNVLVLHQKPSIDRFHLCVDLDIESVVERNEAADYIKIWLRFALDRQAKEIRLFDETENCPPYYVIMLLPNLTSQFLVTLYLKYCIIKGEMKVKLESLKKLTLDNVRMNDEKFQSFMSGCPSLQELVIRNPYGIAAGLLNFSAPNIDKLSLVFEDEFGYGFLLEDLKLNIPSLKSLYIEITDCYKLDIIDVSSVRDMCIEYCAMSTCIGLKSKINEMLLEKFEGTEVLQLSQGPSEEFLHSIQKSQLLQFRWKRIILQLQDFCEICLVGIYHLMTSLKHFEELIIYTTEDFKASTNLPRVEFLPTYMTPQLKTITLHGYGKSWNAQLHVIEALLKSAAVLDKFVIVPIKHQLKEAEELKFVKHVSRFPRASSSAKVIFA